MKLLIQGDRIVGTATDDYTGPDAYIDAPEDFDASREYSVIDGQLVPVAPTAVTPRQARLALLQIGKLDAVSAALAAIPDPAQRTAAQIEWEYATVIERNSLLVQSLAAGLGLTDADLDALFEAASRI